MSQTDSNAFDFQEAALAWVEEQGPCLICECSPCECEINDEPSMLTDNDLLED